jgi:hypothetical protein
MARSRLHCFPKHDEAPEEMGAWSEVKEYFTWYTHHSDANRWGYWSVKIIQITLAAAISLSAALGAAVWVPGVLGALILATESISQLFQFHRNYVAYRSAAETLRSEAWFYKTSSGPYARSKEPARLLAERVMATVTQEGTAWEETMRNSYLTVGDGRTAEEEQQPAAPQEPEAEDVDESNVTEPDRQLVRAGDGA